jgi:two-component system, OmpR family, phosphate regulon response regulator OmpR
MSRPYHVHLIEPGLAPHLAHHSPHSERLSQYLQANGLTVTPHLQVDEWLRRLRRLRPDIAVLATGSQDAGLKACQHLRSTGDRLPLILLSSRGDEVDRVLGLEMGADDVLSQPASPRELLARIHAVLRRSAMTPGQPAFTQRPVCIGRHRFEPATRSLRTDDGVEMLSTVEFSVLAELVANPGVAMPRERLLAASHDREEVLLPRAIDVVVMRLRKRIEPYPASPRFIQTVRGHGYMFVPAEG